MNQPATPTNVTPWYKERWFWFVAGILIVGVVGPLTMVAIALHNQDTVVKDDWYKDGKEINMSLERDDAAKKMGISASVLVDTLTGEVNVKVLSKAPLTAEPVALDINHPTLAHHDLHIALKPATDGTLRGQITEEPVGKRYVELGNKTWRLTGTLTFPLAQAVELTPK